MQARSGWRKLPLWLAAGLMALTAAIAAQSPVQKPTQPPATPQKPSEGVLVPQQHPDIIRRSVDLVTSDVIVRDDKGQFVPDLGKNDFELYEDGVKQDLVTFVLTHGGRVITDTGAAPPPVQEGVLLPPSHPPSDASGRVFIIFVDDLHLDFQNTGRIRDLFKKISKELIHDGDMFGIVSTGPSSLSIDMTYNHKLLDEAIEKIAGDELSPKDIIQSPDGSQGPPEVRYRAHVAFSTADEILRNLEQMHDRRKAFIYVSDGYDFDPFAKSRQAAEAQREGATCTNPADPSSCTTPNSNCNAGDPGCIANQAVPDYDPFSTEQNDNEFAEADLVQELAELTREANRANVTMYTIDPRGLVGGPDIDQTDIDPTEWQDHIRETQDSLRVIAQQTGGLAVVNQNDFDKAIKRIDAETSDYYVLGYYSSNPDPTKKVRKIEVRVKKSAKYVLNYKTQYSLRPPPKGAVKTKKGG
ncbi:MAG TPA: VWA domain-containing protein [Vicinamibacterales bacterium]